VNLCQAPHTLLFFTASVGVAAAAIGAVAADDVVVIVLPLLLILLLSVCRHRRNRHNQEQQQGCFYRLCYLNKFFINQEHALFSIKVQ
jgi:hypothetical protein